MSRHVAVTGASSGLGEAIARAFGAAGDRLTLVARAPNSSKWSPPRSPGGPARPGRPRALRSRGWLPEAEAAFGPVDVLVNAAGCQVIAPFADVDARRGRRMTA